jgi:hypothetical protein
MSMKTKYQIMGLAPSLAEISGRASLIVVFLLVGCVPVLERADRPDAIARGVIQKVEASHSVLILPVWRKVPFFSSGVEASKYLITTPVITTGAEVGAAYKNLPVPLNCGLVGPACQVGSDFVFEGIYIVADSSEIFWLQYNWRPSEPDWSVIKTSILSSTWLATLKTAVQSNSIVELCPEKNEIIWGACKGRRKRDCCFNFDSKDQASVLNFLSKIPRNETSPSVWSEINKTAGEFAE